MGGSSLKPSVSITQELPKYLRGFHKCSREDAIQLAGLIYKAQFDNNQSQLANIPKILRELVPENLMRLMSLEEWKKVPHGSLGGTFRLLPLPGTLPWQDEHIPCVEDGLGLSISHFSHIDHNTSQTHSGQRTHLALSAPPAHPS